MTERMCIQQTLDPVVINYEIIYYISFQEKYVSISHIESRKSQKGSSEAEVYVEFECTKKKYQELIHLLKLQPNIICVNPAERKWREDEGKNIALNIFSLSARGVQGQQGYRPASKVPAGRSHPFPGTFVFFSTDTEIGAESMCLIYTS